MSGPKPEINWYAAHLARTLAARQPRITAATADATHVPGPRRPLTRAETIQALKDDARGAVRNTRILAGGALEGAAKIPADIAGILHAITPEGPSIAGNAKTGTLHYDPSQRSMGQGVAPLLDKVSHGVEHVAGKIGDVASGVPEAELTTDERAARHAAGLVGNLAAWERVPVAGLLGLARKGEKAAEIAPQLLERLGAEGGATLEANGAHFAGSGFAVADPALTSLVHSPDEMQAFLKRPDVQAALQSGAKIGKWTDPATGATEINISNIVGNKDEALSLARRRNEKAIGHLENGEYQGDVENAHYKPLLPAERAVSVDAAGNATTNRGRVIADPTVSPPIVPSDNERILARDRATGNVETTRGRTIPAVRSEPIRPDYANYEPRRLTGTDTAERPLTGGLLSDAEGKPITVYRGEHGPSGLLETRGGSFSFAENPETANLYAMEPNVHGETAAAPRVTRANLAMDKPWVNTPDDPFVDVSHIRATLGDEAATQAVLKNADGIQNTNYWEEKFGDLTPEEVIQQHGLDALNDAPLEAFRLLDDPKFVEQLKAKGFDGATHAGSGESSMDIEHKVFDQGQVRPISGGLLGDQAGGAGVRVMGGMAAGGAGGAAAGGQVGDTPDERFRNSLLGLGGGMVLGGVAGFGAGKELFPALPRPIRGGFSSTWRYPAETLEDRIVQSFSTPNLRSEAGAVGEQPERIIAATFRDPKTGTVYSGINHADAADQAKAAGVRSGFLHSNMGFATTERPHVTRKEATAIARAGNALEGRRMAMPGRAADQEKVGLLAEDLAPGELAQSAPVEPPTTERGFGLHGGFIPEQRPLVHGRGARTKDEDLLEAYERSRQAFRAGGPVERFLSVGRTFPGAAPWYSSTRGIYRDAADVLGEDAAAHQVNKLLGLYMPSVTAMSDPYNNLRRSLLWKALADQGIITPSSLVGEAWPARKVALPEPFGHIAQKTHQAALARAMETGIVDPIANPKPASFGQDLTGNAEPATFDTVMGRIARELDPGLDRFFSIDKKGAATPKPWAYQPLSHGLADAAHDAARRGLLDVEPGLSPVASYQSLAWHGGTDSAEQGSMYDVFDRLRNEAAAQWGVSPVEANRLIWAEGKVPHRPLTGGLLDY